MKSLYFEAQIIFSPPKKSVKPLAATHGFIVSDIKNRGDRMMTTTGATIEVMKERTEAMLEDLKKENISVLRYKVYEVWMDSNNFDTMKAVKQPVYDYGT